jgi:pyridoxamine 5'-phosphate oxidase
MINLNNFRKEYNKEELDEKKLSPDPFKQFDTWFDDAVDCGIDEPNLMVLSTISELNRPSSRIVLLKKYNHKGFAFFTNYNSRKGKQIEKNPFGVLLFPWHTMERQIRIEGKIGKLSKEESDAYFRSRPAGARIAAWASPQSEEIPSREYLENLEQKFREKFVDNSIPRPSNWGGYRLIPDLFEFWQGRKNRLHDRIEYTFNGEKWDMKRLAP